MTNKRKAAPAGRLKSTTLNKDSTPFRGLSGYKKLRRGWLAENPHASELETLQACVHFACVCGLVIKRVILKLQLAGLRGER